MNIREWRRLAVRSAGLLVLVLLISMLGAMHKYGEMGNMNYTVHAQHQEDDIPGELLEYTLERQGATAAQEKEAEKVSDRYIKILKPSRGQALNAYLENNYMDFSISLTMEGIQTKEYHAKDVERFYREESYSGAYQGDHDMVKKIRITSLPQDDDTENVCVQMQLMDIYEPTLYETSEAFYISLEKPQDIYDYIVVVDAGHGGNDDGTISMDGKYCEKDYALRIVGYLQKLLEQDSNIKAYYTRLSDTYISKAQRVRLANAVDADAFVSIHCNSSQPGDRSANGIEALYSGRKRAASESLTSKQLSVRVLNRLCELTGRKSRGVIERNGLYLMNHSKVPVTIIEVGYMSNQSDLRYLLREKNQKEIAKGVYQGMRDSLGNE